MQTVLEMVALVTALGEKKIAQFDGQRSTSGEQLVYDFFDVLKSGVLSSDEQAAEYFYDSDPSDNRYRTLKSRLRERLRNTVLSSEFHQSGITEFDREVIQIFRDLTCMRIFSQQGQRHSAVLLARSLLRKAERFDITEVRIACLRLLRSNASLTGKKRDFAAYSKELELARELQELEIRVDEYVQIIRMQFIKAVQPTTRLINEARTYAEEIKQELPRFDHFHLTWNYFRLKAYAEQIAGNFDATLKLCDDAEAYRKQFLRFSRPHMEAEFALKRLVCCYQLRDYEAGKASAENAVALFNQGYFNFFQVHEPYFLLTIHGLQFNEASEIYARVVTDPRFAKSEDFQRERWQVFGAYLVYVKESGWCREAGASFQHLPELAEILYHLEESYTLRQDRSGYYTVILVAEILCHLLIEGSDWLNKRQHHEHIRNHINRNLKSKSNERGRTFLKMLLIAEEQSFDKERTLAKTARWRDLLLSGGDQAASQPVGARIDSLELIPYEQLWDHISARILN